MMVETLKVGGSDGGSSMLLVEGNEKDHEENERSTCIPKLTFTSGKDSSGKNDSNVVIECVDGDDGDVKVVFHVYYV